MGTQAISDAALNAAAPRPATSVVSSNVIYLADLPAGASIPAYRRARLRGFLQHSGVPRSVLAAP